MQNGSSESTCYPVPLSSEEATREWVKAKENNNQWKTCAELSKILSWCFICWNSCEKLGTFQWSFKSVLCVFEHPTVVGVRPYVCEWRKHMDLKKLNSLAFLAILLVIWIYNKHQSQNTPTHPKWVNSKSLPVSCYCFHCIEKLKTIIITLKLQEKGFEVKLSSRQIFFICTAQKWECFCIFLRNINSRDF